MWGAKVLELVLVPANRSSGPLPTSNVLLQVTVPVPLEAKPASPLSWNWRLVLALAEPMYDSVALPLSCRLLAALPEVPRPLAVPPSAIIDTASVPLPMWTSPLMVLAAVSDTVWVAAPFLLMFAEPARMAAIVPDCR